MKKTFSVILALLLLCGCNGKTNIKPVKSGLEFTADATYYNESYECRCTIQKNGDTEVEFTYPADIKGLKYYFSSGGVSVKFKNIEYISQQIVFENSVATLIYDVLSKCGDTVTEKDKVFYIEGISNDLEYKLEVGATGFPIRITTHPSVAKIEFKNVKII